MDSWFVTNRGAPRTRLRPRGADDLGLRRAFSDRLLPVLVGAMAFLAALALAGMVAASALSAHWQQGAAAALTVQVPDPDVDSRATKVLQELQGIPGVLEAHMLDETQLQSLLRPWLGSGLGSGPGVMALPLPGVIAVQFVGPAVDTAMLASKLDAVAPGTLVEAQDVWMRRLSTLAHSLQACAGLAMGVVCCVAVAVVMVATRAGLMARREAIEIVHGLGATDRFIAGQFADRATRLAGLGAMVGALFALPVLLVLTDLAAPFGGGTVTADPAGPTDLMGLLTAMPPVLWLGLGGLPLIAAAVGWLTAQTTVRRWLRRLL
jgi:cell division transport system permease protein